MLLLDNLVDLELASVRAFIFEIKVFINPLLSRDGWNRTFEDQALLIAATSRFKSIFPDFLFFECFAPDTSIIWLKFIVLLILYEI